MELDNSVLINMDGEEVFKMITHAYSVLSDERARAEYDQERIQQQRRREFAFPQSSWASRFEFGVHEDTEIETETGSESEEEYRSYDVFGSGNYGSNEVGRSLEDDDQWQPSFQFVSVGPAASLGRFTMASRLMRQTAESTGRSSLMEEMMAVHEEMMDDFFAGVRHGFGFGFGFGFGGVQRHQLRRQRANGNGMAQARAQGQQNERYFPID